MPTFPCLCFWIGEGAPWLFKGSFFFYSSKAGVSSGTCKAQRDTVCDWEWGCRLQCLYGVKVDLYLCAHPQALCICACTYIYVWVCPCVYVSYCCVLAGRKMPVFKNSFSLSALKIIKIRSVEGAFIFHFFPQSKSGIMWLLANTKAPQLCKILLNRHCIAKEKQSGAKQVWTCLSVDDK